MNIKSAMLAMALALSAVGLAHAEGSIGEDSNWHFRSASDRAVQQGNLNFIQLQKAGYYDQLRHGGIGGAASGGYGGAGLAGATATSNYFQLFSQTVNNCQSSGTVGAPISCSGAPVANGDTGQTSKDNSVNADTDLTGNTLSTTTTGNTTAGSVGVLNK